MALCWYCQDHRFKLRSRKNFIHFNCFFFATVTTTLYEVQFYNSFTSVCISTHIDHVHYFEGSSVLKDSNQLQYIFTANGSLCTDILPAAIIV